MNIYGVEFKRNRFVEELNGEVYFKLGKHAGELVSDVASEEPWYLRWALSEFQMPDDVRDLLDAALEEARNGN